MSTEKKEKQGLEYVVLARLGEIALKGLNRNKFEQKLMQNMSWRLRAIDSYEIFQSQSRIWVEPRSESAGEISKIRQAAETVSKVFGLVSASPVLKIEPDREMLEQEVLRLAGERLSEGKGTTFKIEVKRGDKSFPQTSPELAADLGHIVLKKYPEVSVAMKNPAWTIYVEIRESWYIYSEIIPGVKGLPVGTSGRALLLLSGGIDSPVAGYMMASRGLELEAIYFHTYPFTSDQAKEKVIELARKLSYYSGRMNLHIVDFTDIQLELNKKVPSDMMTIVMRRMMMRIASRVAEERGMPAVITGESLGQVASQTLQALGTTNIVTDRPVFRPLIAIDKDETIRIAREIDTYETSILPYDDCCTVFVAKHPKTRPTLEHAVKAEQDLDVEKLTNDGLERIEMIRVSFDS